MAESKNHAEFVEATDDASSTTDGGLAVVGADLDNIDKSYWRSPRFLGSCAAIVLMANSLFFGYAIPVNILSVIDADIGPSSNIYLVSLINTLIKGVCLLLVGSISDTVGRRYFMIGGQTCGLIGAILSATSKNVNSLIGASVFTGMAGSAQVLYPLLSQEIVPNKYRGWSQGVITLLILPSIGFGPIIGRTIVATSSWRWCYWVNAIITALSLILYILCYFPPNFHQLQSRKTKWQQIRQIDYVGFFLYAGGLICLLLALSWGGKQYPWKSARPIALLIVGVLVLVAFVVYEVFVPQPQPLLPMSLFKVRNFSIAVVVGSIGQMAFYAQNVLWPTHVTNLYTHNNRLIGWMTCTTGLALTVGEIITGPLFKRLGNVKWQLLLSSAGLTLFMALNGALANEHRQNFAIAMTALIGLFIGWIELVAIVVAGLVIPPERIGTGQAFFASTRAVSGTIATSIYLAIYNSRLATNMPQEVTSRVLAAGLPRTSLPLLLSKLSNGTAAAVANVPGINAGVVAAMQAGQKRAWASSLSTVYLASLAFAGMALIFSYFSTDVNDYLTSFVNKKVSDSPVPVDSENEKV